MIEAVNLTKRFSRHVAVDDISFRVEPGTIVGFLGPNGAGKTTTIRMLTGFLPPSSGSASVAGHDIFRESLKARSKIGYMPERVPLYNEMRVREFLKYRARLKGLQRVESRRKVSDVIDTCGLSSVRQRMIKTLSKGFRQRVGLADALVADPELLILDEPTNGLDPNQIRQIRELIRKLGNTRTILLSTHILHEVELLCSHVIIIDSGKILAADTPSNLISDMRAAGRVTVELKVDPDTAAGAISRLDQVRKVSFEEIDGGWTEFQVLVESGTDARERLAKLAAQHGWPIRSLFRHQSTLEEVFVELTRKD